MTSHHYVHVTTDYLYILRPNVSVHSAVQHFFDIELTQVLRLQMNILCLGLDWSHD